MKKIALIMSMLFFYTGSALALECKVLGISGDPYRETQPVGNVLISKNSKNGEKIWVSELFTRNVECTSGESEPVYFYFFPKVVDPSQIPKGMKFGITYNGYDTDLNIAIPENQRRIKTNINVSANQPEKGTIKVRIYIKKDGEINSSHFSGQLDIYQLDGEKGLNMASKGNYRFSLRQLNNITEITCDSNYSWRNFKIDINNDLTLKSQQVSKIGNLNLTCHANNDFGLSGKLVMLDVYPDTSKSAEAFTTNLDGLNFTFNVAGQKLIPNNKKQITVPLDDKGQASIDVDGLFKLNYQEPGQDWLYNPTTATVTPEKVSIKSDLRLIDEE